MGVGAPRALTAESSDLEGFAFARRVAPLLLPFVENRAAPLWVEDVAYAEHI